MQCLFSESMQTMLTNTKREATNLFKLPLKIEAAKRSHDDAVFMKIAETRSLESVIIFKSELEKTFHVQKKECTARHN